MDSRPALMLLRLNGRMVDLRRGSVTDDAGHSITTLRPQAAEILKVLAANPGEIVTKDELMQTVWGNIAVSDDSSRRGCQFAAFRSENSVEGAVSVARIARRGRRW